jgi:Transcription factor TFIID (or TATA-binding protein, TBP)
MDWKKKGSRKRRRNEMKERKRKEKGKEKGKEKKTPGYISSHVTTNIVSIFTLRVNKMNPVQLYLNIDYLKYNPRKFTVVIFRSKNPKTSFLIFCTSTVVCIEITNIQQFWLEANKLCNFFLE